MKKLENLFKISKSPLTIIDVGARGGINHRWKQLIGKYPVNMIGFDADKKESERLNSAGEDCEKYLPHAIFSPGGKTPFYITRFPGSCGLLKPCVEYIRRFYTKGGYDVLGTIELDTESLDHVLNEHKVPDADYLKLDAEAAELTILENSEETLKNVFAVETEVWFNSLHDKGALFTDLDSYFRKRNFMLFDIARTIFYKRNCAAQLGGPKGQAFVGNALYMRDLLDKNNTRFCSKDKLIKSVIVSMAYGYYDYAMEIADNFEAYFGIKEISEIKNVIRTNGKRFRNFKGRYRMANMLKSLAQWMSVEESDVLGNW